MCANFGPRIHHRHSIRLRGYDYSQCGVYFVTIVAFQRECLFGDIVDGEMVLNPCGQTVTHAWFDLPRHYRHVELGAFVVMPNHVHGMIILNGRGGSPSGDDTLHGVATTDQAAFSGNSKTRPYKTVQRHALPEIIRAFKSFSARRINLFRHTTGIPVWQRNYYEHIIRNEREMDHIRRYLESNPIRWAEDHEYPTRE